MNDQNYRQRLANVIPGGAHTYSRGFDQYPSNAPDILYRGEGAYVYTKDGERFLDYGMALRANILGYSDPVVNRAAFEQIELGNNLTKPSFIELEAAELLVDHIESIDMVKFTKNGSSAVSAAVKLARAYTGKNIVVRCRQHPFFSYDDWFIGSTPVTRGIPHSVQMDTKLFDYNDISSLEKIFEENSEQIACVVLEPSTTEHPKPSAYNKEENFLHDVQRLCKKNGALFILDEMITGFRWHLQGAQKLYNISPDLTTFGKAMANGFSVAAVAGKREFMKLGAIDIENQERTFLLSTTHGAEMCGLGAFVATLNILKSQNVVEHIWTYGQKLIEGLNHLSEQFETQDSLKFFGVPCSPHYMTLDKNGENNLGLRTLLNQELIKNGIIMPWIALSFKHSSEELAFTFKAFERSLAVYKKGYLEGYEKYLEGPVIKPVFRKYN